MSVSKPNANGNGHANKITLKDINSPKDLRACSVEELTSIAEEVRQLLITTCAANGGHIGANLGVVELTMAIHYVFNTPKDKVIFDTSHQAYTHKIITGRREQFPTLCKYPGGLSRFIVRGENEYDLFSAGHASTGLSAAMGFAEAAKHKEADYQTVCVVGDGALTGGMAYEALNNMGYNQTDINIILNDNKMGISHNVGAMFEYLKRLSEVSTDDRARRAIGTIFEKLGFKYYGPVKGHDFNELIHHLEEMKHIKGPKILHVLTDKGLGVDYMENDKATWHEHAAFDIPTGIAKAKLDPTKPVHPSIESIATSALIKLAEKDKTIVGLTAAMAAGTGMVKFGEKFPDRFYDVGIAEEHAITFSAGLAAEGMKPVANIYSPFMQRAFDQIMHDVASMHLPVRMLLPKAAITGDGWTQGGILDLSYLRIIPNVVVAAPMNENELYHMVKMAVDYDKGPIAVRFPKGTGSGMAIDAEFKTIPIGKAEVLKEGKDITLLAIGWPVQDAVKAAAELEKKGISATVINARFAKPLDEETILKHVKQTGKVITIEENTLIGGFGSAVLECLERHGIKNVDVKRLGAADGYIPFDTPANIKKSFGMAMDDIVKQAEKMTGKH
ncbi:MAG: 1-deoxy-D-xylulose-5-phosphate synthase [Candidatus Iainarchaeum archaeon]|uniref:1-deoxy-D-xylulose-5-phosphate synthase n=1 Tax=Candidatus Iainarchaeum sp. TaxID=3101447 RepID=A0A7T9DKV6_9ARCH|nr:MAG: 1-deoxy-D-xylulose-5-phosphate synthase [Candidatus Diapherotrites archaeon]